MSSSSSTPSTAPTTNSTVPVCFKGRLQEMRDRRWLDTHDQFKKLKPIEGMYRIPYTKKEIQPWDSLWGLIGRPNHEVELDWVTLRRQMSDLTTHLSESTLLDRLVAWTEHKDIKSCQAILRGEYVEVTVHQDHLQLKKSTWSWGSKFRAHLVWADLDLSFELVRAKAGTEGKIYSRYCSKAAVFEVADDILDKFRLSDFHNYLKLPRIIAVQIWNLYHPANPVLQ